MPATTHDPGRVVGLGAFTFVRDTGELRGAGEATRLAPQPAALLALLVDHAGEVVSRDTIKRALWPDTAVDFEAGLHQCIRQIRVALGDDAARPQFVETIPRRGYRLRREALSTPEPVATARASRRSLPLVRIVALLAIVLVAVVWWLWPSPLRIAVMSFADPRGFAPSAEPIGERVLVDLVARVPAAIVVGPRSTEPLRDAGRSLPDIARTLDTDFVLNANHSGTAEQPWMLVELIRVADGEHVWVERYDLRSDDAAIAAEIVAGTAEALVAAP